MKIASVILLLTIPILLQALSLTSTPLCAYNTLGFVPGYKNYTFEVTKKLFTPTYKPSDFNVTRKNVTYPSHPFFNWVGLNNFRNNFQAMGCQIVPASMFGNVCGIPKGNVSSSYNKSFGPDIVFKCQVPKNHFLLSLQFVPKINGWSTSASGKWSIFRGIYKYNSTSNAKSIIKTEGTKIFKKINSTKLNAYDVSTCLNMQASSTQSILASKFNKNILSHYALNIKAKTPQVLVDEGYLRVLPAGTHFIAGAIYNGTSMVKQICSTFTFSSKDNCNLTL